MIDIGRRYKDLHRLREIIQVLARHGFGNAIDQLGLQRYVSLPRRLLRRGTSPQPTLTAQEHLRLAVEELGPTFIKIGHILSTRPDLIPPAYISELAKLQDAVPPAPWEKAREQIEREFEKSVDQLFLRFEREPFAAASLGQVHRATLPDGQEVVVKVQRPDIDRIVKTDLDILRDLARLVQEHTALGDPQDLVQIVDEFALGMRDELDYRQEGRNAERFRLNFSEEPSLHVPQVHWDYTTKRVLTLERIKGIKIDDIEAIDAAGIDRRELAMNSVRIIIKEVLEDGFFHADPHPGNFFVLEDGRMAATDFGLVGYLDELARGELVRLFVLAVNMETEEIVDQLISMGAVERSVDRAGLRRQLRRLLAKYRGMPLAEIHLRDVMRDLGPITFRYRVGLPPEYWLLAKTMVMMEGIGLRLAPDLDVFAVSEPYVRRFLLRTELPRTWQRSVVRGARNWSDLLSMLPRRLPSLLEQMEQGEWRMIVQLAEARGILATLDSAANRLSISILIGSLIFGLALLLAPIMSSEAWAPLIAVIVLALVVMSGLGLVFLISVWRGWRR